MKNFSGLDWVSLIVLIIGGVNWGMIGIFDVDLVGSIFGVMSLLTRIVYILVGASAVYTVYILTAKTS